MYLVRIDTTSGPSWLHHGRRVTERERATRYPHPSSAKAAFERFVAVFWRYTWRATLESERRGSRFDYSRLK